MSIMVFMILASIPMLSSDKEVVFRRNVDKVAAFAEKAKNYSFNPNTDKRDQGIYVLKYGAGAFTIHAIKEVGESINSSTMVAEELLPLSNGVVVDCYSDKIEFEVGTGKSSGGMVGLSKGDLRGGVSITTDGQVKILQYSPCPI